MAERLVNVVDLLAEIRGLSSLEEVETVIENAPTEEIVRCENCEYYHLFDEGFYDCINPYGLDYVRPDSFCSYGRIREDGKKEKCSFCHEDSDGFYEAHGAFYLTNPFHADKYYLNTGHCAPREIKFCPLCGRGLEADNAAD